MRDKSKQYRILFIGNSFTYFNNMPNVLFQNVCTAAGYQVEVEQVTTGGHYLWKHANPKDRENEPGGGWEVEKKLAENKYDFVIIQEQSGCAIADPALFYAGVRMLAEKVRKNGAELYLYATWGYNAGYAKLPTHGGTTAIMEMQLRAAYTAIAAEVDAKVSYVGAASTDVFTNHPEIELYVADNYHPNVNQSTLAAYVHFATVFGEDVREVPYNGSYDGSARNGGVPYTVTDRDTEILKQAAYQAVFVDHAVAEEYRVSSEGVGASKMDFDAVKN